MSTKPERNLSLDVLRGVAILLVIAFHAGAQDLFPESPPAAFTKVTNVMWAGVDLFFVLSGYLISGLLFKEVDRTNTLDLKRFWLRRGMKIWPSYFAAYGFMLAFSCILHAKAGAWDAVRTDLVSALPNLVMIQNYFPASLRWPNSWSLAVEEHFYLAMPALLFVLLRRKGASYRFDGLLAGGALFCVLVLALRLVDAGRPVPNAYFPTHMRADSLCVGVMLGWLQRYRRPIFDRIASQWKIALVLAPLALLAIIPLGSPWPGEPPEPGEPPHSGNTWSGFTIGFTLLYLGFAPLVVAAGAHPEAVPRAPAPLRPLLRAIAFVGEYSYTIYLGQAIVPRTPGFATTVRVARRLHDGLWTNRLVFVLASFAVGILLAHLVERPCLTLRERWIPARRTSS
jgi:peptidoglycan/LPS O-acetylase OafA/YrhL